MSASCLMIDREPVASAKSHGTLTDEEVVARVQRGQVELFELIFDRHFARIERSVRGSGVPEADREDVVAETFVRAFAGIRSFQPGSGTRYLSYLYAIARNLCTDRIRQHQRAPELTFLEDDEVVAIPDESEEGAPLAALLKRERLDQIRAALAMLSPSDREIIRLSYERDLSSREIMQLMRKPSTTAVTTHLYKAMKKLRALLRSDRPGYEFLGLMEVDRTTSPGSIHPGAELTRAGRRADR